MSLSAQYARIRRAEVAARKWTFANISQRWARVNKEHLWRVVVPVSLAGLLLGFASSFVEQKSRGNGTVDGTEVASMLASALVFAIMFTAAYVVLLSGPVMSRWFPNRKDDQDE